MVASSKYPGLEGEDAGKLEQAEQRYAAALSGATELHLRGLRLTSLPESLGNCTALKRLDCGNNKLIAIPEGIGKCAALEDFDYDANQLIAIPESLGNCTALKRFDCSANKLIAIPESLGKCAALEVFDCCDNELTELPESLAALKVLSCDGNPWDPAWLAAQTLNAEDSPTPESLQVLTRISRRTE